MPPTYSLPNNILTTWVASLQKTQHTALVELCKQIADSTRAKKPWHPSKKLYDRKQKPLYCPLRIYPKIFRPPRLPVCRKHSKLQSWMWANELDQRWQILPELKKKTQDPSTNLYHHRQIKHGLINSSVYSIRCVGFHCQLHSFV